jgi:hypothetical protein
MPSDLGFYPFTCVLFILLGLLLCRLWRRGKTTPSARKPPRPTREPKPFAGLTCKLKRPASREPELIRRHPAHRHPV